jgi:hypothetical protein
MTTKRHPSTHHHVTDLDGCKSLLEQLGFRYSENRSTDNELQAEACSIEGPSWAPSGIIRLDKKTDELTCTDNTRREPH